jgi:serine/threonine protein kinase
MFRSPERITGNNNYNYKCDVWGVGLILYELASGKEIPYLIKNGENFFVLMDKIVKSEPPNLDLTDRSPELKNFIHAWYFLHNAVLIGTSIPDSLSISCWSIPGSQMKINIPVLFSSWLKPKTSSKTNDFNFSIGFPPSHINPFNLFHLFLEIYFIYFIQSI